MNLRYYCNTCAYIYVIESSVRAYPWMCRGLGQLTRARARGGRGGGDQSWRGSLSSSSAPAADFQGQQNTAEETRRRAFS